MSGVKIEGFGCLLGSLAVGSFFVFIGGFFLYVGFIETAATIEQAGRWIETPCEILESELREERPRRSRYDTSFAGEDSIRYIVHVIYRYEFDGRQYTTNRYDLLDALLDGQQDWKREVVAELQPGTATVCYVNPHDPSQAVLNREMTISYWSALPLLVFVFVGLAGIVFALVFLRPSAKPKSKPG